jgi:dual specificity tyrosine-phosphorylation-regulated kinase 2/3/4
LTLQIKEKSLAEFLAKVLVFNPSERLEPLDALLDPWIVDGLPDTIKEQHLCYVRLKLKKAQEGTSDKKSQSKNNGNKHNKRNSDFRESSKPKPGHNRRWSDGLR